MSITLSSWIAPFNPNNYLYANLPDGTRCKCAMCSERAEVKVSWTSSTPQVHKLCESCVSIIWDKLSTTYSGTEAFMSFTIVPLGE